MFTFKRHYLGDIAAITLGGVLVTSSAMADTLTHRLDDQLQPNFYVGIGFGASWLNPNTADTPAVNVNDRVQSGAQLAIGRDINKWLSLELNAADLGSAGFSPTGEISYRTFGASGLFYAGKNRHRYKRNGLSAYARLGYGMLQNKATDIFSYEQNNSTHLLVGAGVEYFTRKGLGIRVEGISFDSDVRYGQGSLVYRFGRTNETRIIETVEAPKPTPVAPVAVPIVAAALPVGDDDNDSINNDLDQCPQTAPGVAVSSDGCALFSGVIEGVQFKSGSDELTHESTNILNGVIQTLRKYPRLALDISAHTDSQGDEVYNQDLSERRARSVKHYFESNDISPSRLTAAAYGETQPIANNATAEGRFTNRRVELFGRNMN